MSSSELAGTVKVLAMIYGTKGYWAWLMSYITENVPVDGGGTGDLRAAFRSESWIPNKVYKENPHGEEAATRSTARAFLTRVAKKMGYEPYVIQPSRATSSYRGALLHFWPVDTHADQRVDNLEENSAILGIDVAAYLDPAQLVASTGRPVLVSDPSPNAPANSEGTYTWTVNQDNSFSFDVVGGDQYEHKCWDYSAKDYYVYPESEWLEWLGLNTSVVVMTCDTRRTSPSHVVSTFVPVAKQRGRWGVWLGLVAATTSSILHTAVLNSDWIQWETMHLGYVSVVGGIVWPGQLLGLGGMLAGLGVGLYAAAKLNQGLRWMSNMLPVSKMSHLAPVQNAEGFTRMDSMSQGSRVSKVGSTGSYSCIEMNTADLEEYQRYRKSGGKITARLAAAYAKMPPGSTANALLLCEGGEGCGAVTEHAPPQAYAPENKYETPAESAKMCALASCLAGPVFVPSATLENEVQCVKGRITDIRNTVQVAVGDFGRIELFSKILAKRVAMSGFILQPHRQGEVGAEMNNPRARKAYAEFCNRPGGEIDTDRVLQTFIKAEAYSEPKDPRNITTIPQEEKFSDAELLTNLAGCLSGLDCYGFRSPDQLNETMGRLLRQGEKMGSDFSRFDGRKGATALQVTQSFTRELVGECLLGRHTMGQAGLAHFKKLYADAVARARNRKGRTAHGYKYKTKFSQLSGHVLTSEDNTLTNMFESWYALVDDSWYEEEAMDIILYECAFGGDDGVLDRKINMETLQATTKRHGLVIKEEFFPAETIQFFGRTYTLDLEGNTTSVCDVPRALRNLTVCCNTGGMNKNRKAWIFYLKCISGCMTDLNTPVYGEYCAAYVEAYRRDVGAVKGMPLVENLEALVNLFETAGQDVPYRIRAGLYNWQPDDGVALQDYVTGEMLADFDHVGFELWLRCAQGGPFGYPSDVSGNRVRDVISYLRKPPSFAIVAESQLPEGIDYEDMKLEG